MKNATRWLSILLAAVLLVSLAACDTQAPEETTPSTGGTVATQPTGESTEATELTQATEPTETAGPGEGTDPTESVQPTDPTDDTQATEPAATNPPATSAPEPTQGSSNQPTTAPIKPTEPTAPSAALGSKENPAALVMGSNSGTVKANSTGYYFTWTAENDGTLDLEFSAKSWSYEVHNLTAGEVLNQVSNSNDESPRNPAQISVMKGDNLEIIINTAKKTAGTVTFTAAFNTEKMGTKKQPYIVRVGEITGIRAPAGAAVYFSGRVYGTTMVITNAADAKVTFKDQEYLPSNGTIRVEIPEAQAGISQPIEFTVTNTSSSTKVYSVEFVVPTGTLENPAELVFGNNTAAIPENSQQGYIYEWVATASGTFTLQMQGDNWYYQIYAYNPSTMAGPCEEGNSQDGGTNPVSVSVKKGYVVRVTINTSDGKAADVAFAASFQ